MKYQRKPEPVEAFEITERHYDGVTGTGFEPGSFLVIGANDSLIYLHRRVFLDDYEPVPAADVAAPVAQERPRLRPGDWVYFDTDGDRRYLRVEGDEEGLIGFCRVTSTVPMEDGSLLQMSIRAGTVSPVEFIDDLRAVLHIRVSDMAKRHYQMYTSATFFHTQADTLTTTDALRALLAKLDTWERAIQTAAVTWDALSALGEAVAMTAAVDESAEWPADTRRIER